MTVETTRVSMRPGSETAAAALLVASLLWAGMLLGVSFLATPAKFLAPSLTLPVALDVGRHTFAAFNWVEIGWGVLLVGLAVIRRVTLLVYAVVATACGLVALETAWLLPVLDERVGMIIAGVPPPRSNLHTLYIVVETVKLAALLVLAVTCLRSRVRGARQRAAVRHSGEVESGSRQSHAA